MTRFNYLGESLPTLLERVRAATVPETLRTPLSALATATLIVCAWSAIDGILQRRADVELQLAAHRVAATRTALATLKLEKKNADSILALDRQLRMIRRSGAVLGAQVASVANHLPSRAWLVSFDRTDSAIDLAGATTDLEVLSRTISDLDTSGAMQNAQLIRAARSDAQNTPALVSFELRSDGANP